MDFKLVFLSVFVLCIVGSVYCGYDFPRPPMGSSTGPHNPNSQRRRWIARPVRSISPEEPQEMLDYVEPIVETLRQKRFSVPIIVLPPPPPPSTDYTV